MVPQLRKAFALIAVILTLLVSLFGWGPGAIPASAYHYPRASYHLLADGPNSTCPPPPYVC